MKTLTLFGAFLPALIQDTPEAAARAFVEAKLKDFPRSFDRDIRRTDWEIRCMEKELDWWGDRGARRKSIEEAKSRLEFARANRKKIVDSLLYDIVEMSVLQDGGKQVTVKVWSYEFREKEKGECRLSYEGSTRPIQLVLVDGKWKLKNRK